MTSESILGGQTAWQSVVGMQLGSIWGHGAYQAQDWTADWSHRELTACLELAAQADFAKTYQDLDESEAIQWFDNSEEERSVVNQVDYVVIKEITHTCDFAD